MARRKPAGRTMIAAPAPHTAADADAPRSAVYAALDAVPPVGSPSLKLAQAHQVDAIDRSSRERRAAEYGMDFNGTSRDEHGVSGLPNTLLTRAAP
jgi:hypothetical protein